MINRKPSLVGVIGHPVGHSKSPIIHGYWLQHHDVNGHYIPMEVTRSNFAEVIGILPKMGISRRQCHNPPQGGCTQAP